MPESRVSADEWPLAKVVAEAVTGRQFVRVADDLGTKWWVCALPADADGDSIWQRSVDVANRPGAVDRG